MNGSLTPVERRLVAALDAGAARVTPADLRPPAPPAGSRVDGRRLVAVAGMAAIVLAVACLVLLGQFRDGQGSQVRPLAPPARSGAAETLPPSPVASPTSTSPSPARSVTRRTATPLASTTDALPTRTGISAPAVSLRATG